MSAPSDTTVKWFAFPGALTLLKKHKKFSRLSFKFAKLFWAFWTSNNAAGALVRKSLYSKNLLITEQKLGEVAVLSHPENPEYFSTEFLQNFKSAHKNVVDLSSNRLR